MSGSEIGDEDGGYNSSTAGSRDDCSHQDLDPAWVDTQFVICHCCGDTGGVLLTTI